MKRPLTSQEQTWTIGGILVVTLLASVLMTFLMLDWVFRDELAQAEAAHQANQRMREDMINMTVAAKEEMLGIARNVEAQLAEIHRLTRDACLSNTPPAP